MKEMLKRRLIWISTEDTILYAVKQMKEANVSSVLVVNSENVVVGIITERDIVQKFTMLEVQDKLLAKAAAFMTRPVLMVKSQTLESDIKTLFLEKGIRHFPVSSGGQRLEHMIGMMTVTDLAMFWFRSKKKTQDVSQESVKPAIIVVTADQTSREHYRQILAALQFQPITQGESDELVIKAQKEQLPLLLDIDGMELEQSKRYLKQLKALHQNIFLLLSSHPQLVTPLREHLKGEGHFVVLKPLDISYLLQLLNVSKQVAS